MLKLLALSLTLSLSLTAAQAQSPSSNPSPGRIIGYLPGWATPPAAADLAKAGYTHILLAFGVFSTTSPGNVVPTLYTVDVNYIKSLQAAGIKVLLSLGGASSSVADTTVDFHQAVSEASSSAAFEQSFVTSLDRLISSYGLDGFDFDVESGLNAGGTFTTPSGDIAVLANIINSLRSKHPDLLISLAPQIANVAATSGFDATWGNYASLVMQTHAALSWVGIQLYNSGCAFGIDLVCYDPNNSNSPDASVAFATDLLADWPAKTASGQATGFQPYVSYLNPNQVVLGYPAANATGASDGSPAANTSTVQRAIQCLRTASQSPKACDTYVPPKAYPGIGGVFNWEVTYDANNGYHFATDLKACVIDGVCE